MSEKSERKLLELVFGKDPVIVLIGQSCCGKGTQTQLFKESFHKLHPNSELFTIGMGDEFRNEIPKFTPWISKKLHSTQIAGKRQPFSIATASWVKKMLYEYTGGPMLIEGSPRSEAEACAMLDFFTAIGKKPYLVCIEVSDQEAERRMVARNKFLLKQGMPIREDCSTPERIAEKLGFYKTDVVPGIRKFSASKHARLLPKFESTQIKLATELHLEILNGLAKH